MKNRPQVVGNYAMIYEKLLQPLPLPYIYVTPTERETEGSRVAEHRMHDVPCGCFSLSYEKRKNEMKGKGRCAGVCEVNTQRGKNRAQKTDSIGLSNSFKLERSCGRAQPYDTLAGFASSMAERSEYPIREGGMIIQLTWDLTWDLFQARNLKRVNSTRISPRIDAISQSGDHDVLCWRRSILINAKGSALILCMIELAEIGLDGVTISKPQLRKGFSFN